MKFYKFLREQKGWLFLGLLIAAFLSIKISTQSTHFADGWVYFYFGKLVSEGSLPYRDFYYSSPPLIPYLMGALHALFGFKLSLANLLPTFFSILDAVLIFTLLRKKIGNFALLAVFAYLFSFLNFAVTDYFSEAHPLTTFALAGLLFFENKKLFWSGVFFGLAGLTKLYGLVPALFLPFLIWRDRNNLGKFLGGILLSFGLPNLIFLGIMQREYLDMIFFNHLHKSEGIPKLRIFSFFLAKDFLLLGSAVLLLFMKKLKPFLAPLLAILALAIFYIFFKDIYYLYLKVFLGFFVILLFSGFSNSKRKMLPKKIASVFLILILTNSIFAMKNYFGEQKDKARIDNLAEITEFISTQDGELYGEFSITPLIAFLTEKQIFRNYVDTNEKFLELGIVDSSERARELQDGFAKIVVTKNFVGDNIYGLEKLLPRDFFEQNCTIQKTFPIQNDYEDNVLIVWSCR